MMKMSVLAAKLKAIERGGKMIATETQTIQERYNKAVKQIRSAGIVVRRNVMGCCRSCIDLGLADEVPVIWHYGGQGNRQVIEGDYVNFKTLYFSHDNMANGEELTDSGRRVIAAFEDNGFEVEWERNAYKTIRVVLER